MRETGFYRIKVMDCDIKVEIVGYWFNDREDMQGYKRTGYFDCSNYSDELKQVFESECIYIDENKIC